VANCPTVCASLALAAQAAARMRLGLAGARVVTTTRREAVRAVEPLEPPWLPLAQVLSR
jgi:hypothetical protein